MCNCGNKRAQLTKTKPASHSPVVPPTPVNIPSDAARNSLTKFMYTGRTSLKIIGSATGQPYYFRYRGQILEINAGDSSFMMNIPELSMVNTG